MVAQQVDTLGILLKRAQLLLGTLQLSLLSSQLGVLGSQLGLLNSKLIGNWCTGSLILCYTSIHFRYTIFYHCNTVFNLNNTVFNGADGTLHEVAKLYVATSGLYEDVVDFCLVGSIAIEQTQTAIY